jgi:hypothetical protein
MNSLFLIIGSLSLSVYFTQKEKWLFNELIFIYKKIYYIFSK